jgi:hypothetical protein
VVQLLLWLAALSGCDTAALRTVLGTPEVHAVFEAEINQTALKRVESFAHLEQERGLLRVEGSAFGSEVDGVAGLAVELWLRPEELLDAPQGATLPIMGDTQETITTW